MKLSVRDLTVSTVEYQDHARYTQYDLVTGRPLRDPIELPWLDELYGKQTEGGGNIYAIADAASVEH